MNETAPTAKMPVNKAEEFVSMVHKVFQSNIAIYEAGFNTLFFPIQHHTSSANMTIQILDVGAYSNHGL